MITHLWQEKSKPHVKKQEDTIDSLMSPEEIKWGFRTILQCERFLNKI